MNFDLSDDQRMLQDQARRFLQDRGSLAAARRVMEDDAADYDSDLWRGMAELGWQGAAIPESYGGAGLGYIELCVIAEELGRALAPVPFSSTVYCAVEALLLAGSEAQKRKWLPKLASGETIAAFALAESGGWTRLDRLGCRASGGRISGEKSPIADIAIADLVIVVADNGAGGAGLYIVETSDAGVSHQPVQVMDQSRKHGVLTLQNALAENLPGADTAAIAALLDRVAVLSAFEQVGGAEAALEMAIDYAKNRYAFGRQIGSFQAIKHKLADMYVANQLARSNAYYGAWALSNSGPDDTGAYHASAEMPLAAATARVAAMEAFWLAAKENIQTHGGMGFTWEFDCHLYYRRAKLTAASLGGKTRWKSLLVSRLDARNAA